MPLRFPHVLAVSVIVASTLNAQTPAPLPVKYAGPPTTAPISAADLMSRVYIFADDSMMGRLIGHEGNNKGTAYIEREVRRLGLRPAGDSGGYFQYFPAYRHALDPASTLTADGLVFKAGVDFVATSQARPIQLVNAPVIFGGTLLDTLELMPNDITRGKVLLVKPFVPPPDWNAAVFQQSAGFLRYRQSIAGATVIVISGDELSPLAVRNTMSPPTVRRRTPETNTDLPVTITITTRTAEALLGVPMSRAFKGTPAKALTTNIIFNDIPALARNVVAVVPGSDPVLAGQYVAIGSHNDHVGWAQRPVDHDSILAFNKVVRPEGADSPPRNAAAHETPRIRAIIDSLRALRPARFDSIYNGADDDASGSMAALEIAEAFALGAEKPKRSIVFVWHVGEESGMWGSSHFTENPTVPRDSIVAQLNMDMIGRGGATDVTGTTKAGTHLTGGAGYVQLVGSRRLSTELGDIVEAVNTEKQLGFTFDYAMDADGHPQNIYCRSDHESYARYGIPVVFFTTGGHADYHQVTDEAQYIDYSRLSSVSRLVFETALRVSSLPHRVLVDKARPVAGRCVQ